VYARSTRIQAQPSSIDAGTDHIREQVLPSLAQVDGFVGLSMMFDRDSGLCITTSAWQDQQAMHSSADQAQSLRTRAAELLGGQAEVEEWEIAVMHREHPTHQGACVRSAWLQADLNRIEDAIDTFKLWALPQIEELDGFCSVSFLIHRTTGRAVSSTCFESMAAMQASRELTNQIRATGTQRANATVLDVREFELALAHLRVPELV
jgi:quinol monooxygenase YgiN